MIIIIDLTAIENQYMWVFPHIKDDLVQVCLDLLNSWVFKDYALILVIVF